MAVTDTHILYKDQDLRCLCGVHRLLERILVGRPGRHTISKFATGPDRYLGVLAVISAAFLGAALSSPIGFSDDFFGLEGSLSVFSSLINLVKIGMGSYALAGAAIFVLLPLFSIATAFELWYKHEIHGDKFEKFARRASFCGQLWFLLAVGVVGLIYLVKTSENGVVYMPVYYLMLSVMLQKLILTRLARLVSAVKFVEELSE